MIVITAIVILILCGTLSHSIILPSFFVYGLLKVEDWNPLCLLSVLTVVVAVVVSVSVAVSVAVAVVVAVVVSVAVSVVVSVVVALGAAGLHVPRSPEVWLL